MDRLHKGGVSLLVTQKTAISHPDIISCGVRRVQSIQGGNSSSSKLGAVEDV